MIDDNYIVQTLWISDRIGTLQRICYNSFLDNGHEVVVYSYGNIENLPAGVILKDASEILGGHLVFKDLKQSYATYSDWFRIAVLYKKGGWWIDSDTVCLKKFDTDAEYAFATEIVDPKGTVAICNAFIKMPARSELGREILHDIEKILNSNDVTHITWTEIGAKLLTKNIKLLKLQNFILDTEVTCPINYFQFNQFYTNDSLTFQEDSYAIHFWSKMWEWDEIDPSEKHLSNSYLELLKEKFDHS